MALFSRRQFLAAATVAAQNRLPNIVVILADDLGYGDVGCYNPKSKIPTPNIDRLAKAGMRFTDAHSPSSVCSPTRYGLLTGRYCWRTSLKKDVLPEGAPYHIERGRLTLPAMLREQGYSTGIVGKWHLGIGETAGWSYKDPWEPGPLAAGFDYSFILPGVNSTSPHAFVENGKLAGKFKQELKNFRVYQRNRMVREAEDWSDELLGPRITQKSVDFIGREASGSKPFFLYFAAAAPHAPNTPAPFAKGKSQVGKRGDHVVELDWSVGQILDKLDATGQAGNTLVIFTSDNGGAPWDEDGETFGHNSSGSLRGFKSDAWEGGHRVPFVVKWPGQVPAGSTNRQLLDLVDLMATFAALTGAKLPANAAEDSFNMLPALNNAAAAAIRPIAIHHSCAGYYTIREGDWKLIPIADTPGDERVYSSTKQPKGREIHPHPPGSPVGELYNLAADPAERNNLYNQEPERVYRMSRMLQEALNGMRTRTP